MLLIPPPPPIPCETLMPSIRHASSHSRICFLLRWSSPAAVHGSQSASSHSRTCFLLLDAGCCPDPSHASSHSRSLLLRWSSQAVHDEEEEAECEQPSGRGGGGNMNRGGPESRSAAFVSDFEAAAAALHGSDEFPSSKTQRQIDEKWKHDLYREDEEPASKSIDPKDLRLKLQRRSSQQGFTSTRSSGVRDLREKLSGTMHPQPSNADPPKRKPVSEVVNISRRETADEMPARQSKKTLKQTSSKKTSQPKAESPLDSFLSSLGLEKYSITFQAEEVDMAALRHMTDSDLKALGIPMGPRKKIILALESRA